jgi:hypothetical protein
MIPCLKIILVKTKLRLVVIALAWSILGNVTTTAQIG